jgi:hypothetical protein
LKVQVRMLAALKYPRIIHLVSIAAKVQRHL